MLIYEHALSGNHVHIHKPRYANWYTCSLAALTCTQRHTGDTRSKATMSPTSPTSRRTPLSQSEKVSPTHMLITFNLSGHKLGVS